MIHRKLIYLLVAIFLTTLGVQASQKTEDPHFKITNPDSSADHLPLKSSEPSPLPDRASPQTIPDNHPDLSDSTSVSGSIPSSSNSTVSGNSIPEPGGPALFFVSTLIILFLRTRRCPSE